MNMNRSGLTGLRGFTLIEVLIALAIVAIALSASLRASSVATDTLQNMRMKTFAIWVAQNQIEGSKLFELRTDMGVTDGEEKIAGTTLFWRKTVTKVTKDAGRRIVVEVFDSEERGYRLAHLTGYVF